MECECKAGAIQWNYAPTCAQQRLRFSSITTLNQTLANKRFTDEFFEQVNRSGQRSVSLDDARRTGHGRAVAGRRRRQLRLFVSPERGGPDAFLFGGEALSDGDLNRIELAIAKANLSGHAREGNRIRVPAGQQAAYLAAIADAGASPRTSTRFWKTRSTTAKRGNRASKPASGSKTPASGSFPKSCGR